MMGGARLPMSRLSGLSFWKLCGSGTGEGFTPVPNTGVYAILCVWKDRASADSQLENASIFQRYAARASERYTIYLEPTSARGTWSGTEPFTAEPAQTTGPLAALTRATVKPSVALKFWKQVPEISSVIGNDRNVAFKIGIGEVPLFHQVTFSIWPSEASMADFARKDGPHARAIRAVRDGDWFREELYARFRVTGTSGTWGGLEPLARLEQSS